MKSISLFKLNRNVIIAVIVIVVLLAIILVVALPRATSSPDTVAVRRGDISASVSATGDVVSVRYTSPSTGVSTSARPIGISSYIVGRAVPGPLPRG